MINLDAKLVGLNTSNEGSLIKVNYIEMIKSLLSLTSIFLKLKSEINSYYS